MKTPVARGVPISDESAAKSVRVARLESGILDPESVVEVEIDSVRGPRVCKDGFVEDAGGGDVSVPALVALIDKAGALCGLNEDAIQFPATEVGLFGIGDIVKRLEDGRDWIVEVPIFS